MVRVSLTDSFQPGWPRLAIVYHIVIDLPVRWKQFCLGWGAQRTARNLGPGNVQRII